MTENLDKSLATEEQKDVAQASEAKADAKVGVELSEDDLEAVAGGKGVYYGGGSPT